MKERSLDIFVLLSEIDKKKYFIWDSLSNDQQKELSPIVVMRWMAGITDERQIIMLNEIVNVSIFNLASHKDLLLKLFAICSSGGKRRYSWINYKLTNSKKNKMSVELISNFYKMSIKDAEDTLRLFSHDEIIELAEISGFQKDELKALKKEISL